MYFGVWTCDKALLLIDLFRSRACVQQEMDPENPECVLDGLILQQMKEVESSGKAEVFTDEMLGAFQFIVLSGGKLNLSGCQT